MTTIFITDKSRQHQKSFIAQSNTFLPRVGETLVLDYDERHNSIAIVSQVMYLLERKIIIIETEGFRVTPIFKISC